MPSIFDQDFGQFPASAGQNPDYADWIDPTGRGAKFANTPATAKPDPFERAGLRIPADVGASKDTSDPFERAGLTMPAAKPPAPAAATPSIADAKPGLDEKGRPGWFVPNPAGGHVQVMRAGVPVPAAEKGLLQRLSEGEFPTLYNPKTANLLPGPTGKPPQMHGMDLPAFGVGMGEAPGVTLAGTAAPFLSPALPTLGRGVLGIGKRAGQLGALWAGEKLLEEIIPPEWQPAIVRSLRALGEAH